MQLFLSVLNSTIVSDHVLFVELLPLGAEKIQATPHKTGFFTTTGEILARSLANFYRQYADRHMNSCDASARESGHFDHLLS